MQQSSAMERRFVLIVALMVVLGVSAWWLGDSDDQPSNPGTSTPAPAPPALVTATRDEGSSGEVMAFARIAGSVEDLHGAPLADARVCAFARSPELPAQTRHRPSCGHTDHSGRYSIEQLWEGRYAVMGSVSGLAPTRWVASDGRTELQLRAGEERNDVDLVLSGFGAQLTGVVRDAAGGEIAEARVMAHDGTELGAIAVAHTDDDGRFSLWIAPGRVKLRAAAEGYADGTTTTIAPGRDVELVLLPGSTLVGRVVSTSGAPVDGARVRARQGERADVSTAEAFTREDGRFRIDALEPGRYHLSAVTPRAYGEASATVSLGLAETRQDIHIVVHPAPSVTGRVVVSSTGEGCPQGVVTLRDEIHERTERASTDRDGNVEFRALVPGRWRVGVRCDDHLARAEYPRLDVDGDVPPQRWEVDVGKRIRGIVQNSSGAAIEGARVQASPEGGDPRTRPPPVVASTDAHGAFEVRGLGPHVYRLDASAEGHGPAVEQPKVDLQGDGTPRVVLTLRGTGSIEGAVTQASGKAMPFVTVQALGITSALQTSMLTDDAGTFRLEGLTPGTVRVVALDVAGQAIPAPATTDDDIQGVTTEVIEDEVVRADLVVVDHDGRIHGRVVDEDGGPLPDAFVAAQRESSAAGASVDAARRRLVWGRSHRPVLTDSDGRFSIEGLAAGRYTVWAQRRGGGEAYAQGVPMGSEITLEIRTTASVSGKVTTPDGAPVEDFHVILLDRRAGRWRRDTFFHTEGAWRAEVEPGDYQLRVGAAEGTARTMLSLAAGQRRTGVDFVLAPRATIEGRVITMDDGAPLAGIQTSVRPVGGSLLDQPVPTDKRSITDAEGRFMLTDVRAGRIYVMAVASDPQARYHFGRAVVELSGPGPIDVGDVEVPPRRLLGDEPAGDLGFSTRELEPGAEPEAVHWIVSAIRQGGPASGVGLLVGDEIIGVDGYPVAGIHAYVYRSVARVPAGESVSLELARGTTVQLTAVAP